MNRFLVRLRQTGPVNLLRRWLPNRVVNLGYHLPKAVLANLYYRFPGKGLTVVGVTGTDGKTTTVNLIYHLLRSAGKKVSMVSTLNAYIGDQVYETGLHVTSPDPFSVQGFLKKASRAGSDYFVLEVTSHGLDQYRVWGIPFFLAVYTNISGDHLGYHGSLANYRAAKAKLAQKVGTVVLNADDPGSRFPDLKAKLTSYGLNSKADFTASNLEFTGQGTRFKLKYQDQVIKVKLPLLGKFNVENALAALAAAVELGIPLGKASLSLASFPPLPGRMEVIDHGQEFKVIIDFAHTPKALEAALVFLNQLRRSTTEQAVSPKGKLIVVFGCAGERDPGRRKMGQVAARLADLTIITAEDPRREGVASISDQIAGWAIKGGGKEVAVEKLRARPGNLFTQSSRAWYCLVPDRTEAIRLALQLAREGDLVLITGKGHEQSMCFGRTELPWSDQKVTRQTLADLGYHKRQR